MSNPLTRARATSVLSSPTGYLQARNPYSLIVDAFWVSAIGLSLREMLPLFVADGIRRTDGTIEVATAAQVTAGVIAWAGALVTIAGLLIAATGVARIMKGRGNADELEDETARPEVMAPLPPPPQPRAPARKWPPRD